MKVTILGISRRKAEDKSGKKVTYSNLFYAEPFDEYAIANGDVSGEKCGSVSTSLDTTSFVVGDTINLDYAPSGFTSRDGNPQFRLNAIDLISKSPFAKSAEKK